MAMVQSLDHYWTPEEVGALPDDGAIIKELVLAVDLLSPSTARFDRGLKRQFYLRSPTDELWIVDIESRSSSDGALVMSGPKYSRIVSCGIRKARCNHWSLRSTNFSRPCTGRIGSGQRAQCQRHPSSGA
ncbi:MAG TPA: Uma2 family endonuclease [Gemmatimonadaceae bacterium]|nr:Uma2 family endonuclease [Gemmatimonadaceae bacterium]